MTVLLSYAGVYAAVVIARERTFSKSSWTKAVTQAMSTASSLAVGLALCVVVLRWFALYRAKESVSKDKEQYDVLWQSMMNDVESLGVIHDEVQGPNTDQHFHLVFLIQVECLVVLYLCSCIVLCHGDIVFAFHD